MIVVVSGLLASWFTVMSERAKNLEACQIFSLAAGFLWGVAFAMLVLVPTCRFGV
jgi:hypothetical protein